MPPVPVGPYPSGHAVADKTGDAAPLIAALAALTTLAVMAVWGSRNYRATPAKDPGLSALAAVVVAGTEALDNSGSDRDALIACCAAMDRAMSAGSPGDTPEELLRRAAQAGLISGPVGWEAGLVASGGPVQRTRPRGCPECQGRFGGNFRDPGAPAVITSRVLTAKRPESGS